MVMQKRRFHFDKRKRRYVQLQPDEKVQAGKRKRTESGKTPKSSADESTGVYKKWMRKSKLRVPAVGELADNKAPEAKDLALRQAFNHIGSTSRTSCCMSQSGALTAAFVAYN